MPNWMICEYYGASLDRSKPNNGLPINDEPVNLDYCYSFKRTNIDGKYQLVFNILKSEPIVWNFINEVLRDVEYNRAVALVKNEIPIISN